MQIDPRVAANPVFKKLFMKFDKDVSVFVNRTSSELTRALDRVEVKMKRVEDSFDKCIAALRGQCDMELKVAEFLVNKEMRSKVIMSQWCNKFLAGSNQEDLNPITFAFARFVLNMCLCYDTVDPQAFIDSKVHVLLISLAVFPTDLVAGPSLMGLAHLSLHDCMKGVIVDGGILQVLLHKMVESKSILILTQCCKLCASLSLYPSNKSKIVNSGCMHVLVDLVLGSGKATDNNVQYYAICSILNIIYTSDANRVLSIELKTLKPISTVIQTTSIDTTLQRSFQVMANISFNNSYTGGCILALGSDTAILEALQTVDILVKPKTVFAGLTIFTNICCSEGNQSHIGSKEGLIDYAVRVANCAHDLKLVEKAGSLLLVISLNNTANKSKIAAKGTVEMIIKRLRKHWNETNNELAVRVVERLSLVLSSLLLYKTNFEKMMEINALDDVVKILQNSNEQRIIAAVSMIVATMVPSPDELYRFHEEEFIAPVEKVNALSVLKKARIFGFSHLSSPPAWLDMAVKILNMADPALKRQEPWIKEEYCTNQICFEEFCTPVFPDVSVMEDVTYRGLLFSLY